MTLGTIITSFCKIFNIFDIKFYKNILSLFFRYNFSINFNPNFAIEFVVVSFMLED